MSNLWGVIRTDKESVIVGTILWGFAITLIFAASLLFILNYYNLEVPSWVVILFSIILFLLVTFSILVTKQKKSKK